MDSTQGQTPAFSPSPPEREDRPKHSGPGIASFILGLISILAVIIAIFIIAAGLVDYIDENGVFFMPDPEELAGDASFLGGSLLYLLGVLIAVVGVVLGIVGCVIRNRRRVFAILGLVLNGLVAVGTILSTLLGLLAQTQ